MAKIVITGGCGFIGSHLAEALCQRNDEVIIIDNLTTGDRANVSKLKIKLIEGDINDDALLKKNLIGVQSVFHLAARISVPESIQMPMAYVEANCVGTLKLLDACREAGVKNFVFSSSAAIYGDNPTIPKQEKMPPEPQSPYAMTKLDGEFYCELYRKEYGLNASVLRYFNVFGPRQKPRSAYASVIPLFIDNALHNRPLIIFGDGEQTRDFVFVKDIVQANLLAAEKPGDVFNVAGGQRITINELAQLIIKITRSKSTIAHQTARSGDIKHSQGDNTKMAHQLGFKPTHSLVDALTATINDYADKSLA